MSLLNGFREDGGGRDLRPGSGANPRFLPSVLERTKGSARAARTRVGRMPLSQDLYRGGPENVSRERFAATMAIEGENGVREPARPEEPLVRRSARLPDEPVVRRTVPLAGRWPAPARQQPRRSAASGEARR